MSAQKPHIDFDLAAKVLSGEATAEEETALQQWADLSEANRQELDEIRQLWIVSEPEELQPLNVDAAWKMVDEKTNADNVIPLNLAPESKSGQSSRWPLLAMAASIALLLSVSLGYWWSSQSPTMQTAHAQNDNLEFTLSDGSVVTLAPGSTLEYPSDLGTEERKVALTGKGFFDVSSDPQRPFIVDAKGVEVKVLGTRFEVDTDKSDKELTVNVEEGRVQVTSVKLGDHEVIHAQQSCSLNKSSGTLTKTDEQGPAAFYWKHKTVKFKRTDLVKASEILSGIFDKTITLDVLQTSNCEITATFENEDLDIILEVIASTLHLELIKTENGYTLKGDGC